MIDEKRTRLRKLLNQHGRLGRQRIERLAEWLKDEPRASVRRLRSKAVICLDDIAVFSDLLLDEFPHIQYFFANYKTGTPTPSKFSGDLPVVIYQSLLEAVEASIFVEKERPDFNGPDYNRPNVFCRLPWPDELASGDPEKLIGGREAPSKIFDLAIEYRELGRCFMLRYETKGYLFPRVPLTPRDRMALDRTPLAGERYLPFQILDFAESEFIALYDLNDEETTGFAKRAHALWRRTHTSGVAHYDPITGEVVVPEHWDGHYSWHVGKRALANALIDPPKYAGFAPCSGPGGNILMLGPKPKRKKVAKT